MVNCFCDYELSFAVVATATPAAFAPPAAAAGFGCFAA
jgi:hypothetical protein